MKPYLSIVIPTYNRAGKLDKTLAYLHEQTLNPDSYEIWVVDDGSSDETQIVLKHWEKRSPRVHSLQQKNAGQGVARNLGLAHTEGEIVLFIGDDIYATSHFLEEHVRFHKENPEPEKACLGLTEWWPNSEITPFMEWLVNGGPQFAYHQLLAQKPASFWYFYTSNISLKKNFLGVKPFDESFKGYGWEDIELGYRLSKKGLKLIYTPTALAHHEHPMEENELKKKMFAIGKSAKLFQKKHPELKVIPTGIKRTLLRCIGRIAPLFFFKKTWYWYALSKRYFLEGLMEL